MRSSRICWKMSGPTWMALRRCGMSGTGNSRPQSSFIRAMKQEAMDLSSGTLKVQVDFDPAY